MHPSSIAWLIRFRRRYTAGIRRPRNKDSLQDAGNIGVRGGRFWRPPQTGKWQVWWIHYEHIFADPLNLQPSSNPAQVQIPFTSAWFTSEMRRTTEGVWIFESDSFSKSPVCDTSTILNFSELYFGKTFQKIACGKGLFLCTTTFLRGFPSICLIF